MVNTTSTETVDLQEAAGFVFTGEDISALSDSLLSLNPSLLCILNFIIQKRTKFHLRDFPIGP